MYRLFFIFFTLAFLVLFGCDLDNSLDEVITEDELGIGEDVICSSQDSFYLTGLLNGKVWGTKTHSFIHRFNNGVFEVNLGGNDLFPEEQRSKNGKGFRIVTEAKIHPKKTPINTRFIFLYGDVIGVPYEIPEGDSTRNWIEINYIDADNQIVEGKFEVFLKKKIKDEIIRPVPEPDSIEILNGCFRLAREN